MAFLLKGGNAPLNGTSVDVVLEWTERGGVSHDVDFCALVLGSDGRVRNDSDFVFYNQQFHPSGAVSHNGRVGTSEKLHIDVNRLPDDVEKVALIGSISAGTFGDVKGLALSITEPTGANEELRFDCMGATNETAFVVAEVYRRNGQWKFRAVGQGWDAGLGSLANHFGVNILASEEPADVPAPTAKAAPEPVGAPEAASVPEPTFTIEPGPGPEPEPEPVAVRKPEPVAEANQAQFDPTLLAETPAFTERAEPATGSTGASIGERTAASPSDSGGGGLVRQRLPFAKVHPGTPNLNGEPLALALGQSITLLQQGVTPQTLWLRITQSTESAPGADIAVIPYTEFGEPGAPVYFGMGYGVGGKVRLVNKPTSSNAENTAAIEFSLLSIGHDTAGLVVVATSYVGAPLNSVGQFVMDLVAPDGTLFARSESSAPDSIGSILAVLRRDPAGSWVFTPTATASPGRTAKSLVGAGRWALSA